jgi:hypothetical protein
VAGDVLITDSPERIAAQGVAVVTKQGAGSPGRRVEHLGRVTVVEHQEQATTNRAGRGAQPIQRSQVDLSPAAFAWLKSEAFEVGCQQHGGRRSRLQDRPVVGPGNVKLDELPSPGLDQVDRQGVKQLIREQQVDRTVVTRCIDPLREAKMAGVG